MKIFVILAGVFGFVGVGAGAFGAHALRSRLEPRMLEVWETAARYEMYHALGLVVAAWLVSQTQGHWSATAAGWAFVAGILLFSGSLYGLALTGMKWLGPITPLGGLCFLAGWALVLFAGTKLG